MCEGTISYAAGKHLMDKENGGVDILDRPDAAVKGKNMRQYAITLLLILLNHVIKWWLYVCRYLRV